MHARSYGELEPSTTREGDRALIPPGARHEVFSVGAESLRIACACSPAHTDEDTCLTE